MHYYIDYRLLKSDKLLNQLGWDLKLIFSILDELLRLIA